MARAGVVEKKVSVWSKSSGCFYVVLYEPYENYIFDGKSCWSKRFPMMMAMMVATTSVLNKPMIMGQRDALISFFPFPFPFI